MIINNQGLTYYLLWCLPLLRAHPMYREKFNNSVNIRNFKELRRIRRFREFLFDHTRGSSMIATRYSIWSRPSPVQSTKTNPPQFK